MPCPVSDLFGQASEVAFVCLRLKLIQDALEPALHRGNVRDGAPSKQVQELSPPTFAPSLLHRRGLVGHVAES
jgi:hypothetical protein